MVRKADQERVQAMLRDTITLLCKNGLQFKYKFSIDAVIGVTVDDNEIFLVSMNEVVMSSCPSNSETPNISSEDQDSGEEQCSASDLFTDTAHMKFEQDGDDDHLNNFNIGDKVDFESQKDFSPPSKKPKPNHINLDEDFDAMDDISIIKEERWSDNADITNLQFLPTMGQSTIMCKSQTNVTTGLSGTLSTIHPRILPASSSVLSSSEVQGSHPHFVQPQEFSMFRGRLACSICPRIFHDSESLENHESMHKSTYKFHCKFCMKGFLGKSDYEGHLTMHTGEKQFKCDICDKQYSYRKTLKDHMIFSHNQRK